MDKSLRKRIMWFYFGGMVNGFLAMYVLFHGSSFLEPGTSRTLLIVFLSFAVLDFYMPYAIKKKWLAENAVKSAHGSDEIQQS